MWRMVLAVALTCSLGTTMGLNSNGIRSSKEVLENLEQAPSLPRGNTPESGAGVTPTGAQRPGQRTCSTAKCSNAEPVASSCVRSGDCQQGFCCVRYLTAKRCQRIPLEGDACLLPGRSKRRRNLERCSCGQGFYCSPAGPAGDKKQGVCLSRPGPVNAPRNTRHSGKKRRTAEVDC
ncbi:hypothetical protein NHX12_029446 [Muraenolepis orangiensis]|uniref:Dickkopf-related protein 1/2/4 C-terminal subdomain 1 domain-containing protein n=1 Tax=Muraenolepis orangiensis TaxID=630683 RepID=A0A9Q0IPT0_9TELE|nr:hypothetical protein NHX12_029446 [Muraenolepis orangiensis]